MQINIIANVVIVVGVFVTVTSVKTNYVIYRNILTVNCGHF